VLERRVSSEALPESAGDREVDLNIADASGNLNVDAYEKWCGVWRNLAPSRNRRWRGGPKHEHPAERAERLRKAGKLTGDPQARLERKRDREEVVATLDGPLSAAELTRPLGHIGAQLGAFLDDLETVKQAVGWPD
jgi:hypothetical protein